MIDVLLVDDDLELCELLVEFLRTESFQVSAVHNGVDGAEAALSGQFSMVLLDVTLPRLNGFDVLRTIRHKSNIPVIMLTARGDDVDRIVGLEIGADDYLAKPFNHRELVARMKAIMRRMRMPEEGERGRRRQLQIDDLVLNLANHEVLRSGQAVDVTATEFTVLKTLVEKAGELVTREELTQLALNRRLTLHDRAIDMHVSNLRRKIGSKPDNRPRLKTVRGAGYFYIVD
ncbi:response regulator [Parendozoicomonas haliclonae]|uniref:Transcriptional regulatory protein OmpR n=1 Tax=Parendozoicomonas haliclonae TaxID=1960125 RepID=A0A1X7AIT5_9GAMM|nr:response regulator [Parendozoicomonas haliclonae]SMA43873.1 Transcriptional regulatory protein OmpR [Parendozoicomonas haliclonae]